MANTDVKAAVPDFVRKSKKRMTALVRESVQRVYNGAQVPVNKGGKMRVKTGFLRASGTMSLTGMPSGPVRGDPEGNYEPDGAVVTAVLQGFKPGDTIYVGWTANYARYRNIFDGFLDTQLQNWSSIVRDVTLEIKARIK